MANGVIPSDRDAAILRGMKSKLDNITGEGVINSPAGVTISPRRPDRAPNAGDYPLERCYVVTVYHDYLICRYTHIEPNEEGIVDDSQDFPVAKPWGLRKTPFDGLTLPNEDAVLLSYSYDATDKQKRTVTDTTDSSTEDQVVVPKYVPTQTISGTYYPGSEIVVRKLREGAGVTTDDDEVCEYEDANHDGRWWAEDNGS